MTADSVLVALISRSVLADSMTERRAAGILLDMLRTGDEGPTGLRARLDAADAYIRQSVAENVRALMAEYGLPEDTDVSGRLGRA